MHEGRQHDLRGQGKSIRWVGYYQGGPINYANEKSFEEIVAIPQIYIWRVSFHFMRKPFPWEGEEEKPLMPC